MAEQVNYVSRFKCNITKTILKCFAEYSTSYQTTIVLDFSRNVHKRKPVALSFVSLHRNSNPTWCLCMLKLAIGMLTPPCTHTTQHVHLRKVLLLQANYNADLDLLLLLNWQLINSILSSDTLCSKWFNFYQSWRTFHVRSLERWWHGFIIDTTHQGHARVCDRK